MMQFSEHPRLTTKHQGNWRPSMFTNQTVLGASNLSGKLPHLFSAFRLSVSAGIDEHVFDSATVALFFALLPMCSSCDSAEELHHFLLHSSKTH